jgi:hypothetical protein
MKEMELDNTVRGAQEFFEALKSACLRYRDGKMTPDEASGLPPLSEAGWCLGSLRDSIMEDDKDIEDVLGPITSPSLAWPHFFANATEFSEHIEKHNAAGGEPVEPLQLLEAWHSFVLTHIQKAHSVSMRIHVLRENRKWIKAYCEIANLEHEEPKPEISFWVKARTTLLTNLVGNLDEIKSELKTERSRLH